MTRHLSGQALATWLRLVGPDAQLHKAGSKVLAFSPRIDVSWGEAVTQLVGMKEIVVDSKAQTWAPPAAPSKFYVTDWARGRAEFVLRALQGIEIDELAADLPPEDQAWVRSVYVA
jgi:hypothetical protein